MPKLNKNITPRNQSIQKKNQTTYMINNGTIITKNHYTKTL